MPSLGRRFPGFLLEFVQQGIPMGSRGGVSVGAFRFGHHCIQLSPPVLQCFAFGRIRRFHRSRHPVFRSALGNDEYSVGTCGDQEREQDEQDSGVFHLFSMKSSHPAAMSAAFASAPFSMRDMAATIGTITSRFVVVIRLSAGTPDHSDTARM